MSETALCTNSKVMACHREISCPVGQGENLSEPPHESWQRSQGLHPDDTLRRRLVESCQLMLELWLQLSQCFLFTHSFIHSVSPVGNPWGQGVLRGLIFIISPAPRTLPDAKEAVSKYLLNEWMDGWIHIIYFKWLHWHGTASDKQGSDKGRRYGKACVLTENLWDQQMTFHIHAFS